MLALLDDPEQGMRYQAIILKLYESMKRSKAVEEEWNPEQLNNVVFPNFLMDRSGFGYGENWVQNLAA